jgi:glycerophosphoryl diester phosphodiesterase
MRHLMVSSQQPQSSKPVFPDEKPGGRSLVVAHKGASGYLPGNTLRAFELAVRQGADCIEFDVQLTGDGQIVIYDRWYVDDGKHKYAVAKLPLARLRELHARCQQMADLSQEGYLPTMSEALKYLKKTDVEVVVEIKNSLLLQPCNVGQRVVDELQVWGMLNRSYLLSFDHLLIAAIEANSKIRKGILYVGRLANLNDSLRATGACFIETRNDFIDAQMVADLHTRGIKVCGWSTNDSEEIKRLLDYNVDMITTDLPDVARRLVSRK